MSCLDNCDQILVEGCIAYTGDDVPELGIVQGKTSLLEVEQAVIARLLSYSSGAGIKLADLSISCPALSNLVSTDKTLLSVLQGMASTICSLSTSVSALQATPSSGAFDTGCLTLPASPTKDQILQALLTKVCSINSRLSTVESSYVTAVSVPTLISNYFSTTGTAPEYTRMPKYVALPYHGPLSVFDSAGKGLASAGYDKVYICNGQSINGFTTPNYSGRSPIGANSGYPTGTLDSNTNPALNPGYQVGVGEKKGSYTHTLSVSELAAHSHTVTDPGHKHHLSVPSRNLKNDSNNGPDLSSDGGETRGFESELGYTGISLQAAGNSQPHNNLSPVVGTVFIMYIP